MDKIKVIKFGAEWCAPCKQVDKVLEYIKQDYPALNIEMLNIENPEDQRIAVAFGVRAVPTVVVLNNPESTSPEDLVVKWVGGNAGFLLEKFLKDYTKRGELPSQEVEPVPTSTIAPKPKDIVQREFTITAQAKVNVRVDEGATEDDIKDVIYDSINKQLSGVGYYNIAIDIQIPEVEELIEDNVTEGE